jgi:subtilisin family serine protease
MMKFNCFFSLAAICVMVAVVFPQSRNSKFVRSENAVANRYIVLLNEKFIPAGAAAASVQTQAADLASVYGAAVVKTYSSAVKGFSAIMSENDAMTLSSDSRVSLVEADREMSVSSIQTQSNAPWNLDRVDQRNLPWDSTYNYPGSGAGVHIYIIDTGIRVTHSDFGGRASVAYDGVGDGQNGNDCNGHGTHVAGIAAGATWGVAKQAYLHAVRVLPCSGSGLISDVLDGVDWVTFSHQSPAVANISSSSPGDSPALEAAITNSIASGVVYTIAAGNSASDACGYTPARTPNALTVGVSAQEDQRAPYSNYGSCVDIFAPGHQIVSDYMSSDTATAMLSGSSMSAPMVAGTAAIYLGMNPAASPATVTQIIKASGTANVLTTNDTTSPNLLLYTTVLSPTAATVTLSGRVLNSTGRGVRNIPLTLTDPGSGTVLMARTNMMGFYHFINVQVGSTYVITAFPNRQIQITNPIRSLFITDPTADVNFIAETYNY